MKSQFQPVCVQLPTYADNVSLPAAAAAIIALLSTGRKAANPPNAAAAGEWNRQTDGPRTVT